MTKIIFSIVGVLLTACLDIAAVHASMQEDVDQAVTIIQRFQEIPERAIPDNVLRDAKGVAILTVTKAGFIGSARGGSGIVIARTAKGWSGPSAIGTGGIGVGFQAGVEITEFVILAGRQCYPWSRPQRSGRSGRAYRGGKRGAAGGHVYV